MKSSVTSPSPRFFELDYMKGIAVILMVIFHFFYIGTFYSRNYQTGRGSFLYLFAKISHTLFLFIIGMNLMISYQKWIDVRKQVTTYYQRQLGRALKLSFGGLIMTAYTRLEFPDMYIKFGIFQFVSTMIVLSIFISYSRIAICVALVICYSMTLGKTQLATALQCNENPLFCSILGVSNSISSMDHFSILNKAPVVLWGMLAGSLLYVRNDYKYPAFQQSIADWTQSNPINRGITTIGQYSLSIYFIHFALIFLYYKIF